MNEKNKIRVINTLALKAMRYPTGIISWSREKIVTDIKTRKLLTMPLEFHPKSSSLRLYTKWEEGGRGLVSIRATIQDFVETRKIHEHMST